MALTQLPPLFYIVCIIALYELEENIQFPSTIRLLENAICRQHYASPEQGDMPANEAMCKISLIQHQLAVVRGWYSMFSTLPGQWRLCFLNLMYSLLMLSQCLY